MMTNDPSAELPAVQEEKKDLFEKVKIGMSLTEFRDIMPEAYVAGQCGRLTAYELTHAQKYVTKGDIQWQNFWWGVGSPKARTHQQKLWFYFYEDKLLQWGKPDDWPDQADIPKPEEGASPVSAPSM